jgi:hypothetical protein
LLCEGFGNLLLLIRFAWELTKFHCGLTTATRRPLATTTSTHPLVEKRVRGCHGSSQKLIAGNLGIVPEPHPLKPGRSRCTLDVCHQRPLGWVRLKPRRRSEIDRGVNHELLGALIRTLTTGGLRLARLATTTAACARSSRCRLSAGRTGRARRNHNGERSRFTAWRRVHLYWNGGFILVDLDGRLHAM